MRFFVVGATGATGLEFVKQALAEGHSVTVYVRNASKVKENSANLKVREGSVFNKEEISAVLPDHDAVVSCLGFSRTPQPITGYLESHKALIEAMMTCNVNRLVTMSSWWSDTRMANNQGIMTRWVILPFLKPYLDGMRTMEQFLEKTNQGISYTVVRPPQLGNGPKSEKQMYVSEDFFVETGTFFNKTNRSDVASFMLVIAKTNEYSRKMIAITTTPKKQEAIN